MQQMKALLPMDDRPGTYFMALFLLGLTSDMRDHLIAKEFKDCTKMAEYADLLYRRHQQGLRGGRQCRLRRPPPGVLAP